MSDPPDPQAKRRITPESVGQHLPSRTQDTTGVAGFFGINLVIWAVAILVALVFIAVVLYFAL